MKIVKHYSIQHSDKVLNLVKTILKRIKHKEEITLQSWANGREQGYQLRFFNLLEGSFEIFCVNFAQQRNSDLMLVIPGMHTEFDPQSNHPDDVAWNRRKEFSNDYDAAKFIVEKLLSQTIDLQKIAI
jgi:hypothetical protein